MGNSNLSLILTYPFSKPNIVYKKNHHFEYLC